MRSAPECAEIEAAVSSGVQLVSNSGCNLAELVVGARADAGNTSQANHDNQSEHDGVLNSGRAIFFLQEVYDAISEILHVSLLASEMHACKDMRR